MASNQKKPNQKSTSRGSPSRGTAFRWTAGRLAKLGAAPDHQLAKLWDIGTTTVYKKRTELGIPSHGRSNKRSAITWPARELRRLGKESDYAIAQRLKISVSTVAAKRRQLQIPSYREQQGRRPGRKPRAWKKSELKLLGKHSDAWVAQKLKMGRRHVYAKRLELGIPSLTEKKSSQMWTRRRVNQLGKVPDRVLAEEIGVTVATVSNYRKTLGIDSYRDRKRKKDRPSPSDSKNRQRKKKAAAKESSIDPRRPRKGK